MAQDEINGIIDFTPEGNGSATLAGTLNVSGDAARMLRQAAAVPSEVALRRAAGLPTPSQPLWAAIRNRTEAIGFNRYVEFIERVLCSNKDAGPPAVSKPSSNVPLGDCTAAQVGSPTLRRGIEDLMQRPTIYGTDAYRVLKLATQAFLMFEAGVVVRSPRDPQSGAFGDEAQSPVPDGPTYEQQQQELLAYLDNTSDGVSLPYLKRIVDALLPVSLRREGSPFCDGLLQYRFTAPSLIEYIWSYWTEESGMMQAMNAVSLRFQNRRLGTRDPLIPLTLAPIRPLSNLMWGWLQDEHNRLSLPRRAAEYRSQYGLELIGKAVSELETVESRPLFLETFHTLLYRALAFYSEDADTTRVSEGFPVLQALKQLHLELAYGAVNQFGDLTWTARCEMLMAQWLLSRDELREFLGGRPMVPYRESWMRQVDTMNRLQGWTETSVTQFRDLAVFGEQLLLSVRYDDWTGTDDQEAARNWARAWKTEVQCYVHAYQAATGVDLAAEVTTVTAGELRYGQPSHHMLERNRNAARRAQLSAGTSLSALQAEPIETIEPSALSRGRGR